MGKRGGNGKGIEERGEKGKDEIAGKEVGHEG